MQPTPHTFTRSSIPACLTASPRPFSTASDPEETHPAAVQTRRRTRVLTCRSFAARVSRSAISMLEPSFEAFEGGGHGLPASHLGVIHDSRGDAAGPQAAGR